MNIKYKVDELKVYHSRIGDIISKADDMNSFYRDYKELEKEFLEAEAKAKADNQLDDADVKRTLLMIRGASEENLYQEVIRRRAFYDKLVDAEQYHRRALDELRALKEGN